MEHEKYKISNHWKISTWYFFKTCAQNNTRLWRFQQRRTSAFLSDGGGSTWPSNTKSKASNHSESDDNRLISINLHTSDPENKCVFAVLKYAKQKPENEKIFILESQEPQTRPGETRFLGLFFFFFTFFSFSHHNQRQTLSLKPQKFKLCKVVSGIMFVVYKIA